MLTLSLKAFSQHTYTEISLPELLKKKQQNPDMVIVDVRTNGEYYDTASNYKQGNIGHIKGTLHIELQELQRDPEAIKKLDAYKDKEVYLICSHSYRSRVASNILLKNGFKHVNNVRGGMTEWFRRYDELSPFMASFYETSDKYKNISPAQLYIKSKSDKLLMIGIASVPVFFYDTLTIQFYQYYPAFKKAIYFNYSDSLQVFEKIKKEKPSEVVLFNTVNYGGAELADWLTQKGIENVSFLVGAGNLFYEYALNKNLETGGLLEKKSRINFITPSLYCADLSSKKEMILVDLRTDTLFNKINTGTKYNFKHLKSAVNFYDKKGAEAFMQQFTDTKKQYVLISRDGITGLDLADSLTKKGYAIQWLIGGLQRYEWYMNNLEGFPCMDQLVTQ